MNRSFCLAALGAALSAFLLCAAPICAQEENVDWEETIERLTQKVRRTAQNEAVVKQLAVAHNNRGVDLAAEGEWELARHHLKEALALDADSSQFQKNLGSVYLSQAFEEHAEHRYARARASVQKSLKMDSESVTAYTLLGDIEYAMQRLKEAKDAWQRAQALDPDEPQLQDRITRVSEEIPIEGDFRKISQAHFDLRYEDPALRSLGFDIRSALLEARRVIGSDFGYWPKHKTIVLIYSAESFRAMRQETPEWLAGQFDGKIRIPLPGGDIDLDAVKQTLFHEYTHALIHEITKGQCPVWFNEGLAQYQGGRYGVAQTMFLEQAVQNEALVPWEQLNDLFDSRLALPQVALGYQQAHSIIEYIIERYGFWRIRKVLEGFKEGKALPEALQAVVHRTPERLESNWRDWLPRYLSRS